MDYSSLFIALIAVIGSGFFAIVKTWWYAVICCLLWVAVMLWPNVNQWLQWAAIVATVSFFLTGVIMFFTWLDEKMA